MHRGISENDVSPKGGPRKQEVINKAGDGPLVLCVTTPRKQRKPGLSTANGFVGRRCLAAGDLQHHELESAIGSSDGFSSQDKIPPETSEPFAPVAVHSEQKRGT